MEKVWKQIQKTHYSVSNDGEVRNDETGKILKQQMRHMYFAVRLYNSGKNKLYNVHRLVAEAFIPNPDNLPQVNHKDENKANNCIENLEWCDGKYNCNYGLRNRKIGDKVKKATVCIFPNGETRTYERAVDAANELGLIKESVHRAARLNKTLYNYRFYYVS